MMKMLHKGGIEPFCYDFVSYENHFAQTLPHHWQWLKECTGKAVKVLDPQRCYVPQYLKCDFVWMDRDPGQQALSILKFIAVIGGVKISGSQAEHRKMMQSLIIDREVWMKKFAKEYPDSRMKIVSFEKLLRNPLLVAASLQDFVRCDFDYKAAAAVVKPRSPLCLKGFLEVDDMVAMGANK